MVNRSHRQRHSGPDEPHSADAKFEFVEPSLAEEPGLQFADELTRGLLNEPESEDDFYRGGGGAPNTAQSGQLDDHRKPIDSLNSLPAVLFGLGVASAFGVAIVVGVSMWVDLRGSGFAFAKAAITGGGLFAASTLTLYIGWSLGHNRVVRSMLPSPGLLLDR